MLLIVLLIPTRRNPLRRSLRKTLKRLHPEIKIPQHCQQTHTQRTSPRIRLRPRYKITPHRPEIREIKHPVIHGIAGVCISLGFGLISHAE